MLRLPTGLGRSPRVSNRSTEACSSFERASFPPTRFIPSVAKMRTHSASSRSTAPTPSRDRVIPNSCTCTSLVRAAGWFATASFDHSMATSGSRGGRTCREGNLPRSLPSLRRRIVRRTEVPLPPRPRHASASLAAILHSKLSTTHGVSTTPMTTTAQYCVLSQASLNQ